MSRIRKGVGAVVVAMVAVVGTLVGTAGANGITQNPSHGNCQVFYDDNAGTLGAYSNVDINPTSGSMCQPVTHQYQAQTTCVYNGVFTVGAWTSVMVNPWSTVSTPYCGGFANPMNASWFGIVVKDVSTFLCWRATVFSIHGSWSSC